MHFNDYMPYWFLFYYDYRNELLDLVFFISIKVKHLTLERFISVLMKDNYMIDVEMDIIGIVTYIWFHNLGYIFKKDSKDNFIMICKGHEYTKQNQKA